MNTGHYKNNKSTNEEKIEIEGEILWIVKEFLEVRNKLGKKNKNQRILKVLWDNGDVTWEDESSIQETVNEDVEEFITTNIETEWIMKEILAIRKKREQKKRQFHVLWDDGEITWEDECVLRESMNKDVVELLAKHEERNKYFFDCFH